MKRQLLPEKLGPDILHETGITKSVVNAFCKLDIDKYTVDTDLLND